MRISYLLSIVMLLSFSSANIFAAVEMGVRSKSWPWMWLNGLSLDEQKTLAESDKIKWRVAEANLDNYKNLGASWNIVVARQKFDGPDSFVRLKTIVKQQKSRGIDIVVRLIEDPEVYKKFSEKSSAKGFSSSYYDWVAGIAKEIGMEVDVFLVSNEIDHGLGHNKLRNRDDQIGIDYGQYTKLFNTAKLAIRKFSPNAKIADHGVSAFSMGLALAADIDKEFGTLEAYNFWIKFMSGRGVASRNVVEFKRMLLRKKSKKRITLVNNSLENAVESDLFQIHYYNDWSTLQQVLNWSRDKMGAKLKPMIAAEVGYRIPGKAGKAWDGRDVNVADMTRYSEQEHAENMVKNFVILAGNGTEKILYWNMRHQHHRSPSASLYLGNEDAEDFVITKASNAYSSMSNMLQGAWPRSVKLNLGPEITEYAFARGDGEYFSVVWVTDSGVGVASVVLEKGYEAKNLYGQHIQGSDVNEGKLDLKIGDEPVYILWKRAALQLVEAAL
jgi:hypothetical protein